MKTKIVRTTATPIKTGSHVQKMTMPVEQWDSLISQGITTFSKIELTLAGFGRSSRLVKVEKVDDNG